MNIFPYKDDGLDKILQHLLEEAPKKKENAKPRQRINLSDYILLETTSGGRTEEMLVAKHRLALDERVKSSAEKIGISLNNHGKGLYNQKYIRNINWVDAVKLMCGLRSTFASLELFHEFLYTIDKGRKGLVDVVDGRRKRASQAECERIWNDIVGEEGEIRGELFNTRFRYAGPAGQEELTAYNHYFPSNDTNPCFKPANSAVLDKNDIIMEAKNLSLSSWVQLITESSLPTLRVPEGHSLKYEPPEKEWVSPFVYVVGKTLFLICSRDMPSYEVLGIREVRKLRRKK